MSPEVCGSFGRTACTGRTRSGARECPFARDAKGFGATAMLIQSQHTADSAYKDRMKILVVEDDREAADYLEKAFAEAGHTAHVASDGESGFVLAAEGDYDVLVVDRMLPRRDGLSLIAGL